MRTVPVLAVLALAAPGRAESPGADPDALANVAESGPTGDEVLVEATNLLASGEYEAAIALSVPAISDYPALAPSFAAIVKVATDQLERARAPSHPVPGGSYRPGDRPRTTYRMKKAPKTWKFGFDAGFPSGLRAEAHTGKTPVEDFGVRTGGNWMFFDGVASVWDTSVYMDFAIHGPWQFEAMTGFIGTYGWLYGQIGGALQYDPKGPLMVNVGARLGPELAVLPDASVGFVW